jgi:leucyl aminopeptidase
MDGPGSTRVTRAVAGFDPLPSRARSTALTIDIAATATTGTEAIGIPVASVGDVRSGIGVDRALLLESGFTGALGQTLALPRGEHPVVVAVGVGDPDTLDAAGLRDAAAAFARAAGRDGRLATTLGDVTDIDPETAGQAIVEGILLARYRYRAFVDRPSEAPLTALTLVASADRTSGLEAGAARGRITAEAVQIARDLANTPATHLTATRMAETALVLGAAAGLGVEVFDKDALLALGCGGLLGVNMGSDEPPRMIKLTYTPKGPDGTPLAPTGHLALVGKGIMYDAGGISLKPSDAMHAAMKQDMSGAAAVLGAMLTLRGLGCRTAVTGYLMCTDNMPSGKAMRLGDVLTIRGGMTVEVFNTDAEGRLVMADALVLASELDPRPDAVVTIATLTGAALRTFGTALAATLGNDPALVDQIEAAGARTDEPVWELPLVKRYRRKLDSAVADIKNLGGENAGTITAGLFLEEFTGGVPFGHLDICGPMMTDTDDSWRSVGATAFGTRLLSDLAMHFRPPRG